MIRGAGASGSKNGIVLDNCDYCTVTGNVINDQDTDIWLKPTAKYNFVSGNTGNGSNAHVLDQGSNNLVIERSGVDAHFGGDIMTVGGIRVGSTGDPGDGNLVVDNRLGIGVTPGTFFFDLQQSRDGSVAYIKNSSTGTGSSGKGLVIDAGVKTLAQTILNLRANDGTPRFVFYSDGTTTGFCPQITEQTGIENPTPDDYLDWALADAKKPHAPFDGPWYGKAARSHGIKSEEEIFERYGRDWIKMAEGVTIWAERARDQINSLESKITRLEKLISNN